MVTGAESEIDDDDEVADSSNPILGRDLNGSPPKSSSASNTGGEGFTGFGVKPFGRIAFTIFAPDPVSLGRLGLGLGLELDPWDGEIMSSLANWMLSFW